MEEKQTFTELDEKKASLFVGLRSSIRPQDINDSELHTSIKFLFDPKLFDNIINEIRKKGISGEYNSIASIFLCLANIWVTNGLQKTHCMVNSSSSAGKDYITKAVFDVFPAGIKDYRTKITAETFSYWRTDKKSVDDGFTWDGRLLYLEDCSQELLNSSTFRVMLSGGSKATVVRDQHAVDLPINGRPLAIITTATTKPSVELLNRFLPVSLDESSEQTIGVMFKQTGLVTGESSVQEQWIPKALALLRPVKVLVPFGKGLNAIFPSKPVSVRRDFARFLSLIQNSAAFYQYQRSRDENGNVLATWDDYDNAIFCYGGINQNSIKLTRSQQKVYDSFEGDAWFFVSEVAVRSCLEVSWTRDLLQQLVEKELVECKLDEVEAKTKAKLLYRKVKVLSNLPRSQDVMSGLKVLEGESLFSASVSCGKDETVKTD